MASSTRARRRPLRPTPPRWPASQTRRACSSMRRASSSPSADITGATRNSASSTRSSPTAAASPIFRPACEACHQRAPTFVPPSRDPTRAGSWIGRHRDAANESSSTNFLTFRKDWYNYPFFRRMPSAMTASIAGLPATRPNPAAFWHNSLISLDFRQENGFGFRSVQLGFPSAWAWNSFRPVWNSFSTAWNSFRTGWEGRPRRRGAT